MAAFKEPKKFNVVPGNAADVTAIQDAASVLNPSMADIFPAIYQVPLGQGGKAPERTTFNAFLKLYGEALYFLQRGGVWSYDATADYPAGAVVGYSGSLYLALKDNGPGTDAGAVQPDADSAVWQKLPTLADVAKVLSGYVQTAAVDQTIAGTKTFSKPIAGSVTGSSGSCTGNAATATTATTAKACTGNAATATKLATARSLWGNNFDGSAAITGTITVPVIELMPPATSDHGGFLDFHYNGSTADRTSRIIESASGTLSINNVTITTGKVVTATTFNGALKGNVTGNCSGSSGSCTGNAATATKLAAKRTIALSGAATGTATAFDGSGNISIPVTALSPSAIRAQWYAAYPDGAEAHNAMWGGRDITAAFNAGTVSTNIANGTFKDIFPGDYITKSVTISGTAYTVNWVIADCDYWINKGDQGSGITVHHVVIVPQAPIFTANMNPTNTTEGGYAGSAMYKNVIPACATGIVNAFGSGHILTFRDGITNSVDTSHVSSGIPQWTGTPGWWGEWVSVQCNLMSEKMVYGAPVCSAGAMDNSVATRQMSAFRLSERLINYNRSVWWLRDVVSSANFAFVNGGGYADAIGASYVSGVRPFALLV